jgi:uncharacterized membrane protein YhaH (DUF805 family)
VGWALFGFRGRLGRQPFILGQLFMLSLFAVVIARILAVRNDENQTVVWGLAFLALCGVAFWSQVALVIKRLRDIGLPPLLALLLFVPIVNLIFVVILMFIPSTPGSSPQGPPPVGTAGPGATP